MRNKPLGDLVVGAAQTVPAQTWMVYPLHPGVTWWSPLLPGYFTALNNMKFSQIP